MTGIQLAAHLLARRPDLPIILMSGYGVAVKEADVLAAGIRRFLKKPVPSRRFPLEIRSLLDGSERASYRRD
jgi:FixJ family two-component response regulator